MHIRTISRTLVVGLLLTAVSVLLPSVAEAQDPVDCSADIADYEGAAIVTAQPVQVVPGQTVTITGTGFPPGSTVPISFNPVGGSGAGAGLAADGGGALAVIGSPVADENGDFTFIYTIPADTPVGVFQFEAVCGTFALSSNVNVVSNQSSSTLIPFTTTTLPVTGSNSLGLAQAGLALFAVGGLLVVLATRNRRREALVEG